jgi:hypothetical protein
MGFECRYAPDKRWLTAGCAENFVIGCRRNHGCRIAPTQKEALGDAGKRGPSWMNTRQAGRAREHAEGAKVQYRQELAMAVTDG